MSRIQASCIFHLSTFVALQVKALGAEVYDSFTVIDPLLWTTIEYAENNFTIVYLKWWKISDLVI